MSANIISEAIEATVSAGLNCVRLPAPSRGVINRLAVVLPDSDKLTAVTLYDREDACSAVSVQSANEDDNKQYFDPKVHQISERLTAEVVGSRSQVIALQKFWAYENFDEEDVNNNRRQYAFYVEIDVDGTLVGETTAYIGYTVSDYMT
jgi:hypothetical protein